MSTALSFFSIAPKGWPAWLPLPANRPDVSDFAETLPAGDAAIACVAGGWFDSSLDLKHGLEVVDLGPVEWLDEWEGAFAA